MKKKQPRKEEAQAPQKFKSKDLSCGQAMLKIKPEEEKVKKKRKSIRKRGKKHFILPGKINHRRKKQRLPEYKGLFF